MKSTLSPEHKMHPNPMDRQARQSLLPQKRGKQAREKGQGMRETRESNVKQEQDQTARSTAASASTVASSSRMHMYRLPPLPYFPMHCPTCD
ncbi:hypothetical protein BT96DRAFT_991206 [Gymnopus androsaceus JB14]|uniref:Uncharacterized protein n=1 Tax=Gymnopus androsaceus JB14 TaxID=1447944 RepID=A0A6A4HWR5_9AGAR|nr:hypothetical protein BT96DRAFT_991206 [Gymnopus androsaceus JB14]